MARRDDLDKGKNNDLVNELEKLLEKVDRRFQDQIRQNTKALTDSYEKFNRLVETSFSRTLNSFSQGLNTGSQIRSTVQSSVNNRVNKQSLLVDAMTVKNATFENVIIGKQVDKSGNTLPSGSHQSSQSSSRSSQSSRREEDKMDKIERLISQNYTPDNASIKGLTGQLVTLVGAWKNAGSSGSGDISKFSRYNQFGFMAAQVIERSIKNFIDIGVKRFENAVNKFDQVYQQNYGTVAAFTGRDRGGYKELQSQISQWTRENYRGSLNSAKLLEDISKNLKEGSSEQFSIAKAQQDAIINQANPAINTSTSVFSHLQTLLGPNFSRQIAGMLEAVRSTAGSATALVEQGDKLLSDTRVLAYNSRYDRFAQDNADFMAKLSAAVDSGWMDVSQMNEMVDQLSQMMDPVSALKSGSLATKLAIVNPGTDLSDLGSMANALINANTEIAGWANQGTSRTAMFSNAAIANSVGANGAMYTHNARGYDLSGFSNITAGNLDYYGAKAEQDVADEKFVTELERQNNWWQNSMSADVVSKFKESYPDAYEVFRNTTGPALKEISDLIWRLIRQRLVGNMIDGASNLLGKSGTGGLDFGGNLPRLGGGRGSSSSAGSFVSKLVGSNGKLFNTSAYSSQRMMGSGVLKSAKAGLTGMGRALGGAAGIGTGVFMGFSDYSNYKDTYSEGQGWKAAFLGDNSTGENWNWGNAGSQALKYGSTGAGIGTLIGGPIGTLIGGAIGAAAGMAAEGIRAITASAEKARKEAEYSASSWGQLEKALDAANSGVERTTDPFVKYAQEASQGYSITDQFGKTLTVDGSHRTGLSRVPFDNYRAILHKEESVLTEQATKILRSANPKFWTPQGAQELADSSQIVQAINNQTDVLARAYTYDPNSLENQLMAKIQRNKLAGANLSVIGAT